METSVKDEQSAAIHRFYNTTELLESVLAYLPVESIVIAVLADKRMHHIILDSPRLRHNLRLQSDFASSSFSDHACVLVKKILLNQNHHIFLRQRWDLPCIQHYMFEHPDIAYAMGWSIHPSGRHLQGLLDVSLEKMPVQVALRVPLLPKDGNQQPAALFRKIIYEAQGLFAELDERLNLDFLRSSPETLEQSSDNLNGSDIDEGSSAEGAWQRVMPFNELELHPNFHAMFGMTRWLCVPISDPDHIDWTGCQLPGPPPCRPFLKLFIVQDVTRERDWPRLEDYGGELWTQMNVTMPPRNVIVYPAVADQLGAEPFMISHTQATMGNLLEAIEARMRPSYSWSKLDLRERDMVEYQVNHLYRKKCAMLRGEAVYGGVTQVNLSERDEALEG